MTTIIITVLLIVLSLSALATIFYMESFTGGFDGFPVLPKILIRSLIMMPLATAILINSLNLLVFTGFMFFLIGDILAIVDVKFSIPAFFIGHILIGLGIINLFSSYFYFIIGFLLIMSIYVYFLLFSIKSKKLNFVAFIYSFIVAMVFAIIASAIVTPTLAFLTLGYFAFYMSDIELCLHSFVKKVPHHFKLNSAIYYFGIFLIALFFII